MKKVNIMKVLLISILFILSCKVSYCAEGTIRMQVVNGGALWDNVTVSESYAECEKLNSSTSTLGTTALRAHLTTDADWSIMAIFSVSQYGGATSNTPAQTTGNKTGIYNLSNEVQTTGLFETTTAAYKNFANLFDGTNVKPYVRKWNTDRLATNFVGFTDTWGWYGSAAGWGTISGKPASIKRGLFGGMIGTSNLQTDGSKVAGVTFRPVIWN